METTAETHLELQGDLHFIAHTRSGHDVHLDSSVDPSAPLAGITPMELQLVTLAGCTGMDVISILRKMRQDVTSYDLRLSGERVETHPRVYTSILLTHAFAGSSISEQSVRRAIELSMTRYCPVFAMLHPTVAIRERYDITDPGTNSTIEGEVVLTTPA